MAYCEPSHEKPYWVCEVRHEPVGIVQTADEVGYALALALVRVNDHFGDQGVEPFAEIQVPAEVSGLVVDFALDRLESCLEFKRMRWREGHNSVDGEHGPKLDETQAVLGTWSA